MSTAEKWNRIYEDAEERTPLAANVLVENQHLLPTTGAALDLACGLGGNALLLAEHGMNTEAWDISETAITKLQDAASKKKLPLAARVRDVISSPPPADSYDVIVVSRFLERELMPVLAGALRRDGLIFYQTFIRDKASDKGPNNPDYLLASNELLGFFRQMTLLVYREEGRVGNTDKGFRNEAMLVARNSAHD